MRFQFSANLIVRITRFGVKLPPVNTASKAALQPADLQNAPDGKPQKKLFKIAMGRRLLLTQWIHWLKVPCNMSLSEPDVAG